MDFKRSAPVDLSRPLTVYIHDTYCQDPIIYEQDIETLSNLRMAAISSECHIGHAQQFIDYYQQLNALEGKFLFDETNLVIMFPWSNSFGSKTFVSSPSLSFEKANILFNLSVLYYKLADQESKNHADGLKKAFNYYSQSAGVLQFIAETLVSDINIPQCDLTHILLTALKNHFLGEAQECIVQKAIMDGNKDSVIAKLAAQASDHFENARNIASSTQHAKKMLGDSWVINAQVHAILTNAQSNYRRGLECGAQGKYGEQVARFQATVTILNTVNDLSQKKISASILQVVKTFQNQVAKSLSEAMKDNDVIYHDAVPPVATLAAISRVDMAKAIPFAPGICQNPVFSGLIPIAIHQALAVYWSKRDELIRQWNVKVQDQITSTQNALSEMNLPAAIEAAEQPIGLPDSLFQKCQELQTKGGAKMLQDMMQNVIGLKEKVTEDLKNITGTLERETKSDREMKERFGSAWDRQASDDLQDGFKKELEKLKSKLTLSESADRVVQTTLESNLPYIEALGDSREALERTIPSSTSNNVASRNNESLKMLKLLLIELESIRKKTDTQLLSMKEYATTDDAIPDLLAISDSPNPDNEQVYQKRLAKYQSFMDALTELFSHEGEQISKIRSANSTFQQSCKQDGSDKEREIALKNLDDAYRNFHVLNAQLEEGFKFYSDMTALVEKLARKVDDYAYCRNIQLEEKIQQLSIMESSIDAGPETQSNPVNNVWNPNAAPQYDSAKYAAPNSGPFARPNPGPFPPSQNPFAASPQGGPFRPYAPSAPQQYGIPFNPNAPPQYYGQPGAYPQAPPPQGSFYYYPPNAYNQQQQQPPRR